MCIWHSFSCFLCIIYMFYYNLYTERYSVFCVYWGGMDVVKDCGLYNDK